jgi:hypothetical protein
MTGMFVAIGIGTFGLLVTGAMLTAGAVTYRQTKIKLNELDAEKKNPRPAARYKLEIAPDMGTLVRIRF